MTFKEFQSLAKSTEARTANRSQSYCDWFYGEIHLFHERINGVRRSFRNLTPAQLYHLANNDMNSQYWSETTYTDFKLAQFDAKKYNAKVQRGWYCDDDNPHWFLIFTDIDDALRQAYNQLVREKRLT